MPTLQTKLAELEQEFDANFTGEAWTEQAVADESIREIGGADIREINMDLGTIGGSRPRAS
ncbi:hypothetical protein IDM40_20550 [Nocardiopsis sp. HNM0947]|uniref:Uncharacterized protein n=1 Tax=Nocardiopsis coralli TaxID=2772213 RepID=A0ABR9PB37_9ACTN|nr:hypothetical protein [Nocardiopsis coralli]MBE3001063.1 hypothetical protein [Nocardiopsis coralli]